MTTRNLFAQPLAVMSAATLVLTAFVGVPNALAKDDCAMDFAKHATYSYNDARLVAMKTGGYGKAAHAAKSMDIVETARHAGSFMTLVHALESTNLDSVLKGKGPFTVFAPTDAAFAALPREQRMALTQDPEALAKILKAHVVAGRVTASDVLELRSAKSVNGTELTIDTSDGVKLNNAKVVTADIKASNGVIHIIDQVILPNS